MVKNRRFPKKFSLKKVCELLKVSRSTVYYKEKGESEENRRLMEEIEEIYAHDPSIGYRRMRAILMLELKLVLESVVLRTTWEFVYLMDKMELKELKEKTKQWVEYYNRERPHQSLDYKTPDEVYYAKECNKVAV